MTGNREWMIKEQPDGAVAAICRELGLLPLTARLLYNRGCTDPASAGSFVRKETGVFYDPFLLADMEKAAARIRRAIDGGEVITVYGDYDVDGVTSTTILYQYLASQGAEVRFYIPGRLEEGYGLCEDAVRRLAADGTDLIVTVDTGVTANEEAELIRSLGMSLVVTDHHTCRPTLPDAEAVVDPRRPDDTYPFKELAGVGVTFKLICALETMDCRGRTAETVERLKRVSREYAEYTAIGTVADVMPLRDENRLIVDLGLALLRETKKPGLCALIERASSPSATESKPKYPPKKRKITSSFIGYTIAPRINAAGRIAHADRAVELFLTDSPELADCIAKELCDANRERQEMENRIAEEAYAQIEAEHDLSKEYILVLAGEHWHHGVIGIVASRVTEKYNLPSILISFDGGDGVGKGSGRSIEGFNMIEGLTACEDLLVKYGGHAAAAGLTVTKDNLEAFRTAIGGLAREAFGGSVPPPRVEIDCETCFADVTLRSAEELYLLEPYGVSNPTPLFCLYGAEIVNISALSMGRHTKLTVCDPEDPEVVRTAMLFGYRTEALSLRVGDRIDLVYQMEVNDFQGNKTVQMIVQDFRIADGAVSVRERELDMYRQIKEGTAVSFAPGQTVLPSREDCKAVYLAVRSMAAGGTARLTDDQLAFHTGLDLCRVHLILDIFEEAALLHTETAADGREGFLSVSLVSGSGEKKDLTETPTMKLLQHLLSVSAASECEKVRTHRG